MGWRVGERGGGGALWISAFFFHYFCYFLVCGPPRHRPVRTIHGDAGPTLNEHWVSVWCLLATSTARGMHIEPRKKRLPRAEIFDPTPTQTQKHAYLVCISKVYERHDLLWKLSGKICRRSFAVSFVKLCVNAGSSYAVYFNLIWS